MSRIGNREIKVPASVTVTVNDNVVTLKGNTLVVNAGYSHPVEVEIPNGIEVESVSNTEIVVKGINKELVGEFSANIRKIRKPEPYKGKGIRYKGEYIRRKEGKKASK